jgi:hypothetical protein
MLDAATLSSVGHGIALAMKDGFIIAFALFAYHCGKTSTGTRGVVFLKAVAICGAVALFAATTLGDPTCSSSDPIYGGCEEYEDDGYTAEPADRIKHFAHIFALLTVAAIAGIGNRNPITPKSSQERHTDSL